MANPVIVKYINLEVAKGVTDQAIRQELINKQWRDKDINDAFKVITSPTNGTAPQKSGGFGTPSKPPKTTYSFISEFQFYPLWLDRLFRLGFASIFLVNAIVAWRDPSSFTLLLQQNFVAKHLGDVGFMVHVASANDLILGLLILTGRFRKYVYVWASIWLLLVAGIKLSNLVL